MSSETILRLEAITGLLIFVLDYWKNTYTRGYKLDLWTITVFLSVVVPFFVVGIFTFSQENVLTIGNAAYETMLPYVIPASSINLLGYAIAVTCRQVYIHVPKRKYQSISLDYFFSPVNFKYFDGLLLLLFLGLFVIVIRKSGMGLSLRTEVFQESSIRPLYNMAISIGQVGIITSVAMLFETKMFRYLFMALVYIFPLIISGSRSSLLIPILYSFAIYVMRKQKKFKMIFLVGFAMALLFVALFLGKLRNSTDQSVSGLNVILYGNNFSDLRDFAWLYSFWRAHRLFGKTYLAAMMSFIPSSISKFRLEWSYARVTLPPLGLDPTVHAGLRGGLFSESYINFGMIGVVVMAVFFGFTLAMLDERAKAANNYMSMAIMFILVIALNGVMVSSGFWFIYLVLGMWLIGALLHYLYLLGRDP